MKKIGFKIKDKNSVILHLSIWVIYFMFWLFIFDTEIGRIRFGLLFCTYIITIQMMVAYSNVYFLVPRFLYTGRVLPYCILLILVWGTGVFLMLLQEHWFPFENQGGVRSRETILFPIFITVFASSLPTSILILYEKLTEANKIKQLEKETVEHELKFLKAQVNPHFLFNSINSIFQLIDKDPEKSKEMLAKFSEILRYHLYETGSEKVPLAQEIAYVESYAAMEKLRKGKSLELQLNIQPGIGYVEIIPLVLLTFVENAFKHVSNRFDRVNSVTLYLTKEKDVLHFQVINTKEDQSIFQPENFHSGIGLSNVKKRLDLIYGDSHRLDISETELEFTVNLFILLKEQHELHSY